LSGTFAELAVLVTLASSTLYAAGCVAAWRLARDGVAQAGTPLNFRWLGTATLVGVVSMLLMIALASRAEILGLLAVIVVGATVYLVQSRSAAERQPAAPDFRWSYLVQVGLSAIAVKPLSATLIMHERQASLHSREKIHEYGGCGGCIQ
jgi:hypothetical protein